MIRKKGVSPIIASVLLIVFVILLFVVISLSVRKSAVEPGMEVSEEKIASQLESMSTQVRIEEAWLNGDNLKLVLTNMGNTEIKGFNIRIVGDDGVDVVKVYALLGKLDVLNIEINFNIDKTGVVNKIEVVPIISSGVAVGATSFKKTTEYEYGVSLDIFQISSIDDISSDSVVITWETDKPATSQVWYGLDTDYGFTTMDMSFVMDHMVMLTGLEFGKLYHYRVVSQDEFGNKVVSVDNTFIIESAHFSDEVLVVVNDNSGDSLEVGAYYQQARRIPDKNICHIQCATSESIDNAAYTVDIELPVLGCVQANNLSINFVVLTRGIPLKISDRVHESVDCRMTMANLPWSSDLNPYYKALERFQSANYNNIWLVTRLDGYTLDDAKALVDRSIAAEYQSGVFLFDVAMNRESWGYKILNDFMRQTSANLSSQGFVTFLDETSNFIGNKAGLMGYVSWGSNDASYSRSIYQSNTFIPGSIAETYVSSSARTLHDPNAPGQSLIADLVEQGVTGVSGYVREPYVSGLAHVNILFDRYTKGFNLAESFYMAHTALGWELVVLGDPLCSPYE